jgi:hypothetical protein
LIGERQDPLVLVGDAVLEIVDARAETARHHPRD